MNSTLVPSWQSLLVLALWHPWWSCQSFSSAFEFVYATRLLPFDAVPIEWIDRGFVSMQVHIVEI